MYSPRRSYGSPPPEMSNNPFIDHPSNALTRFPDISGSSDLSSSSGQYTAWLQPSGSPANSNATGYGGQQSFTPSTGYGAYQPQQTGWGSNTGYAQNQQGYVPVTSPPLQTPQMTGRPFQPSSAFGQQLAGQVNNAYGVLPQQQQQQQPQYTGYVASPQYESGYQSGYAPQQPQQQYFAEFDPYAQSQSSSASYGGNSSQYRPPHPRDYVQQHKTELEAWDPTTWKQAQNTFEALKDAWAARKREIEDRVRAMGGAGLFGGGGYGGGAYGGQAQEFARLESLAKEAESNFNSIAASAFQMNEVFTGYRQSGDIASKRRVRESINAALTSLPDWPPQVI